MDTTNSRGKALNNLMPLGGWSDDGTSVTIHEDGLVHGYTTPTEAEISAEILNVEADLISNEYKELRKADYPSTGDQLDALWKGGQAQADMKLIIDGVKAKYPKPI